MAEAVESPPSPTGPPAGPPSTLASWLWRIGMVVFLSGPVLVVGGGCYSGYVTGPAPIEFPLGEPRDVAVDSQGRIYVAAGFYHRVQRYSPEGKFEVGWEVPTSGVFALRTTPDGRVMVATARANKLLEYSADGELLHSETHRKEDLYRPFVEETETTGHYAAVGGLNPHIIDTRTGQTVIETPWWKRPLNGPFPAFAYTPIGLLILFVADRLQRRANRVNPPIVTQ